MIHIFKLYFKYDWKSHFEEIKFEANQNKTSLPHILYIQQWLPVNISGYVDANNHCFIVDMLMKHQLILQGDITYIDMTQIMFLYLLILHTTLAFKVLIISATI